MKSVDILNTNSGKSFDKTLNNNFGLFTAYKNDTIVVDYGDAKTDIIKLNSGIIIINQFYLNVKILIL